MRDAYATVRGNLRANAHRMTDRYNLRVRPKVFVVGTWVYYYNPRRYKGRSPKWARMYTGPYLITHCIGPVNVRLQLNRRKAPFVSHIDKIKICSGPTPTSWLADQMEDRGDLDRERSDRGSEPLLPISFPV